MLLRLQQIRFQVIQSITSYCYVIYHNLKFDVKIAGKLKTIYCSRKCQLDTGCCPREIGWTFDFQTNVTCLVHLISNQPQNEDPEPWTYKSYPRNRPRRPIGLWDVTDPTLSRQLAQMVVWCRNLLTRNFILMLLVLISVKSWVNPRA
jgi:hypothetical protein